MDRGIMPSEQEINAKAEEITQRLRIEYPDIL